MEMANTPTHELLQKSRVRFNRRIAKEVILKYIFPVIGGIDSFTPRMSMKAALEKFPDGGQQFFPLYLDAYQNWLRSKCKKKTVQ